MYGTYIMTALAKCLKGFFSWTYYLESFRIYYLKCGILVNSLKLNTYLLVQSILLCRSQIPEI